MRQMSGPASDHDAISLKSIDIADIDSDFGRVDTNMTNEELLTPEYEHDDMSVSLTAYAKRMSGRNRQESSTERHIPLSPTSRRHERKRTLQGAFSTPNGNRSASPLGRKMSLAVHNASSRIVNLSNDLPYESNPPKEAYDNSGSRENRPKEKDYFSNARQMATDDSEVALQGHSLGVFGPQSWIRKYLLDVLSSPLTEPIILMVIVFQVVVLSLDSSHNVPFQKYFLLWGHWTDWALLAIFIFYSVELLVRSIVSGFMINPGMRTNQAMRSALLKTYHKVRAPAQVSSFARSAKPQAIDYTETPRERLKASIVKRAYLRHSLNRIDLVSILSFWIYFGISITGNELTYHIFIFKALSCLRILRLLNVTEGTSTILRSLKKSAPLLVNVAFFVGFFWVFIAVIGVQAFKGSFRRQCVWVDPAGIQVMFLQILRPVLLISIAESNTKFAILWRPMGRWEKNWFPTTKLAEFRFRSKRLYMPGTILVRSGREPL